MFVLKHIKSSNIIAIEYPDQKFRDNVLNTLDDMVLDKELIRSTFQFGHEPNIERFIKAPLNHLKDMRQDMVNDLYKPSEFVYEGFSYIEMVDFVTTSL